MIQLGIDGPVNVGTIAPSGCCPPSICNITLCGLMCNFVAQLPKGPLWDRAKAQALDHIQACDGTPVPSECTSIVRHAMYAAQKLYLALNDCLWPAIRESSPYTAYDTLDEWLMRLGWQDCYACACRNQPTATYAPIAILNDCGEACCPELAIAVDLQVAVKRGINAVIESLGAKVSISSNTPCNLLNGCTNDCACNETLILKVCPLSETLPLATRAMCSDMPGSAVPTVQAYYQTCMMTDPLGLPHRVYPGVLAAECIVKSMIPPCSDIVVQSCCEVQP
jgi:hypothetical protein